MKRFIAAAMAVTMALGIAGCNISPKMGSGNTVVATADGATVYLRDILYLTANSKNSYEEILTSFGYAEGEMDEYWLQEIDDGVTVEDSILQESLTQAQYEAALLMLAKNAGHTYNKDSIKSMKNQLDYTVMSMASKEKLGERAFYEEFWITADELLEIFKNYSVMDSYTDEIIEGIEISDDEIQEYFDENYDNLREVTVQHVLIQVPDEAEEEDWEAALEVAEDVLAKAEAGEDFAALVQEYSDDGGSIETDGEYTFGRNSDYMQEFEDWGFEASEGDFGIVQTAYGYHVMKFVSTSSFEDLLESMTDTVKSNKATLLIEQRIEDASLEWDVDEDVLNQARFAVAVENMAEDGVINDGEDDEELEAGGESQESEEPKESE